MASGWRRRSRRGRRSGPPGEEQWWDPADQALAERALVRSRELGRGWSRAAMVNNAERIDPYGDDPASDAMRSARDARVLTALDEGSAWRRRRDGSLAVARVELFADADRGAHRAAWEAHATACLDALWRQRWLERDRRPGWIEARWRPAGELPSGLAEPSLVDWVTIEDQTGVAESEVVTVYEHLTVWSGRAVATLTIRHPQAEDLDATAVAGVNAATARLGSWP